ncbi:hypothetical protein AK812_SmicGene22557 [Symbiodinium microadriaticum]|uniref:Uncharacterized protein n=1 Tax=Symbiodinium microadriaticum TaxID=2951 RepID=A0A1Q9DJM9_SYMMI|nr:hypothetical protein AK812_SmicGene22557 [Symbiodinium microadriaticum]
MSTEDPKPQKTWTWCSVAAAGALSGPLGWRVHALRADPAACPDFFREVGASLLGTSTLILLSSSLASAFEALVAATTFGSWVRRALKTPSEFQTFNEAPLQADIIGFPTVDTSMLWTFAVYELTLQRLGRSCYAETAGDRCFRADATSGSRVFRSAELWRELVQPLRADLTGGRPPLYLCMAPPLPEDPYLHAARLTASLAREYHIETADFAPSNVNRLCLGLTGEASQGPSPCLMEEATTALTLISRRDQGGQGVASQEEKDQQDLQDCPSKSDSSNDECAATEARSLPTGFHEDFSERVSSLRHNFPFFDDDILCEHLMQAESNMEQAVLSLSKKEFEPAVAFVVLEPADIPLNQRTCERRGAPKQVYGNVIARTDHSRLPLYCFVVLVMQSNSARCKVGSIARPIPEDRFRLMGDEKGHFWKKKARVPEVGDVVEMQFFEEDNTNYLGLGSYPHKNEDLLCTSLLLKSRSLLAKNVSALGALGLVAVDDVETIWPWKSGLSKFPSVQPGKHIWFVHATKSSLPSVIILRLNHAGTLNFKYRSDASDKISLDFKAGRKHLRDLPVTAAGFNSPPHVLNECFKLRAQEIDHLLVLGLARAERRGPEGYNRLPECSEALQRQLDVESFAEYCQLLVIGILEVPKAGQTFSSPPPPTGGPSKTSPIPDTMPHAYTYFPDAPGCEDILHSHSWLETPTLSASTEPHGCDVRSVQRGLLLLSWRRCEASAWVRLRLHGFPRPVELALPGADEIPGLGVAPAPAHVLACRASEALRQQLQELGQSLAWDLRLSSMAEAAEDGGLACLQFLKRTLQEANPDVPAIFLSPLLKPEEWSERASKALLKAVLWLQTHPAATGRVVVGFATTDDVWQWRVRHLRHQYWKLVYSPVDAAAAETGFFGEPCARGSSASASRVFGTAGSLRSLLSFVDADPENEWNWLVDLDIQLQNAGLEVLACAAWGMPEEDYLTRATLTRHLAEKHQVEMAEFLEGHRHVHCLPGSNWFQVAQKGLVAPWCFRRDVMQAFRRVSRWWTTLDPRNFVVPEEGTFLALFRNGAAGIMPWDSDFDVKLYTEADITMEGFMNRTQEPAFQSIGIEAFAYDGCGQDNYVLLRQASIVHHIGDAYVRCGRPRQEHPWRAMLFGTEVSLGPDHLQHIFFTRYKTPVQKLFGDGIPLQCFHTGHNACMPDVSFLVLVPAGGLHQHLGALRIPGHLRTCRLSFPWSTMALGRRSRLDREKTAANFWSLGSVEDLGPDLKGHEDRADSRLEEGPTETLRLRQDQAPSRATCAVPGTPEVMRCSGAVHGALNLA